MYIRLYLKWITSKDLLYTQGTLLSVMMCLCGCGGGGFGGERINVYLWRSPFAVRLKLPQYSSLAMPPYKIFFGVKRLKLKKKKRGSFFSTTVHHFSNLDKHPDHLKILLKCKFRCLEVGSHMPQVIHMVLVLRRHIVRSAFK